MSGATEESTTVPEGRQSPERLQRKDHDSKRSPSPHCTSSQSYICFLAHKMGFRAESDEDTKFHDHCAENQSSGGYLQASDLGFGPHWKPLQQALLSWLGMLLATSWSRNHGGKPLELKAEINFPLLKFVVSSIMAQYRKAETILFQLWFSLLFVCLETWSHHEVQAGPKSENLVPQPPGMMGVCYYTWPGQTLSLSRRLSSTQPAV